MNNSSHRTMESQTMVVTDYHKKRTMGNVQKEGTMEFPTRWFWCTSKRSCESESCDHISTYWSRKIKEKCGPSAQERNRWPPLPFKLAAVIRRE